MISTLPIVTPVRSIEKAYCDAAKRMGLDGNGKGIMLYSSQEVRHQGEMGRFVGYGNTTVRLWVPLAYALMEMTL